MTEISTQEEYDRIISLKKAFESKTLFFPKGGAKQRFNVLSIDEREKIVIFLGSHSMDAKKYTSHSMYQDNSGLLRIELGASVSHTNPNGETIRGPHIHYFVPGYGICWAKPLVEIINESGLSYEQLEDFQLVFEYFCKRLNIDKDWILQQGF